MVTLFSNILLVVFIAFMVLAVAAIVVQLSRAVREFRAGYSETRVVRSLS